MVATIPFALQGRRGSGNGTDELIRLRVDPHGRRPERIHMEEGWLRNIGFFSNKQDFYIDDGRIYQTLADVPEHRVVYRANMTRAAVARAVAKVLNVHAKFKAVPVAGDPRSRNIAEVSERLFAHILDVTEWSQKKQMQGTMWAAICGSGFYRTIFDNEAGPKDRFYIDAQGIPVNAMNLSNDDRAKMDRDAMFKEFAQGDVTIRVENPFGIFHDWSARDDGVTGCRWMATRHWMDCAVVAEWLGVDEADVQPDEGQLGLTNYEEAIAFFGPGWWDPHYWRVPDEKRSHRTMTVDMWERPSRAYPKGRRIIYASGKVWVDTRNPYVGERSSICHLPFVKQDWMPHPGRFWGASLVEDLVSPQRNLNEARSCLLEFLRIFGRPATFVGSNSGIDPKKMTIEPGGVYTVNEVSKGVSHAPAPNLPPAVAEIGNLVQSDLNLISSASDIQESSLPGQLRSGEALRQIQEQRDIALNLPSLEAVRATRDVGRQSLGLAQMYYDQTRTLKYIGPDGDWTFQDFNGADLVADLIIEGTPGILSTEASERAELMDALQIPGLFDTQNNQDDKDYVLSALHYNTSQQAIRAKLSAQKHREWEIEQIIQQGAQQPVFEWQDHAREARVCIDFMYSAAFTHLDPKIGSLIVQHWQQHNAFVQKAMEQQVQMAAALKGTPGQPGQASRPAA